MGFAYGQETTAREHGEARNIFRMWNASSLALDVYEHGRFADSGTDLGGHSGAYFDSLVRSAVGGRTAHGIRA